MGERVLRRVMLFAKSKYHTRVPLHFARAYEALGLQVRTLNYRRYERFLGRALANRYILWKFRRFSPDVVGIHQADIRFEALEAIAPQAITYLFNDDCNRPLKENFVRIGQVADCLFVSNRGQLEDYERAGVRRAEFLTCGCDPVDHRRLPANADWQRCNVAFIARATMPERVAIMKRLAPQFDVKIYGRQWRQHGLSATRRDVYPEQYARICSGANIVLGMDIANDVELYFSNRTWFTLGCGAFYLTRYIPKLEELFQDGVHLAWWRDFDECEDKIRYYLKHDDVRRRIAESGYHLVHEHHTYQHRVARILEVLDLAPEGASTTPARSAKA